MRRSINALYLMLGTGILLYGLLLAGNRYIPIPVLNPSVGTATGAQIAIPMAKIVLPIYPAQIHNNQWETTSLGVSYLATSPKPGDIGNSVLYGHNWPRLLGRLKMVKPGDKIYVTNPDGAIHRFTVAYIFTVNSDQSEIFANTRDHRITLYTCTDLFDTKRLVVTALKDPDVL